MYTRKQYMNKECTHREYYAQFSPMFMAWVEQEYTKEYLTNRLEQDENLNNLKGNWMDMFDRITEIHKLAQCQTSKSIGGEHAWSLSTGTCAIKEAMRQIVEAE